VGGDRAAGERASTVLGLRAAAAGVGRSSCGVRVERLPRASGKHRSTDLHAWFLARWARRLSQAVNAVAQFA